jgi:4-azaleucine resistance transporter AzlC
MKKSKVDTVRQVKLVFVSQDELNEFTDEVLVKISERAQFSDDHIVPSFGTDYKNRTRKSHSFLTDVYKGILISSPIIFAFLPIAFAFGILAISHGIPAWEAIAMSVFIYAGSSQFIAIPMFASGAAITSIVLATFIINSRYLLMSTAISPHLKGWSKRSRFLFGLQLTDETFALHCARGEETTRSPAVSFGINLGAHSAFLIGTTLGCFANSLLSDPNAFGIDFALPGMFTALLALSLKNNLMIAAALIAVGFFLLLQLTPIKEWSMILAPLAASFLLGVLEK